MTFTSNNSWKITGVLLLILILFLANFLLFTVLPVVLVIAAVLFGLYKLVNYIKAWKIRKKGFKNKKSNNAGFEKCESFKEGTIPDITKTNVVDVDYEEL